MAIIVEEEKNVSHAVYGLGWLVVVVVVLAAAYYIFFAAPPAVVVTPPANFASITPIAQINFDPQSVLNSPSFGLLKEYAAEPTSTGPISVGKSNPFIP